VVKKAWQYIQPFW